MAKTIIVDISPAGNVTIDAQGFTGEECVKATEQIEIALGGEMKRDTNLNSMLLLSCQYKATSLRFNKLPYPLISYI